jgi:hypothetical protein
MDRAEKHAELIKKLEEAHEIADRLNDEIAVSLIERVLRYARIASNSRPKKP